MQADLVENLGMKELTGLRLLNRYDVAGLTQEEFDAAKGTIFSEPNADVLYEETCPLDGFFVIATEYLPGQYDQRADSAAQCVQLLTQGERPQVRTARIIALQGALSDAQVERIAHYLINPVESRRASLEKPESLDLEAAVPPEELVERHHLAELAGWFRSCGMEALVLGCTHFPYFKEALAARTSLPLIDPAEEMLRLLMA